MAVLLGAVPAAAADPCFGDEVIGVDAVMDAPAVDRIVRALGAGGSDCGPALVDAFVQTPTGPMAEVVARAFGTWGDPGQLPLLYQAFGAAMLQPFGRAENVVAGTADAAAEILGADGDLLAVARDPAVGARWLDLAEARYRIEWEAELGDTPGEPGADEWKPLADAAFAACLDDPANLPGDPFDPLGLVSGPVARISIGTRCASHAVIQGWRGVAPDSAWALRVKGLTERYATGGLEWLGLELERSWGQGAGPPALETPPWAVAPKPARAPSSGPPIAAAIGVLLLGLIVLLARSEGGREWLKRGAAVAFGLSLIGAVEVGAGLVGVEVGDELRPLPKPRLEITETGYHRDARHRFFPAQPLPGRARVVVVGASSVVGPGLSEADSIPGVLRTLLNERLGGCVDVVNAGAHGVASPVIRSRAIDAADRLRADAVVVYAGHNEVGMMREKNRYRGALDRWFVPRTHARRTRWWTLLSGLIPPETAIASISEPPPRESPEDDSTEAFIRALEANFDREMTDLARALRRRGVPLVLAQPGFNHHGLRIPTEGSNTTERAVVALQAGDVAAAGELTGAAVEETPELPGALFLRSLALEQSGDLPGAEAAIWACARANRGASSVTPEIAAIIDRLGHREGVVVVDAHGLLHRAAGDHLPGFDLFTDYVHLNPRGAAVVAQGMMDGLDVAALKGRCEER